MSIKLYSGYKLRDVDNFQSLLHQFHDIRNEMEEKAVKQALEKCIRRATLNRDSWMCDMYEPEKDYSWLYSVIFDFEEKRTKPKRKGTRSPLADFGAEVVVLPRGVKDPFAIFYAEQGSLEKVWKSVGFVESYPYWNNTDPPEGVDWEEWKEREREWESAFNGDWYQPPAQIGWSYTFLKTGFPTAVHSYIRESSNQSTEFVPSYEGRVEEIAERKIKEDKFELKEEGNPSEAIRKLRKINDWMDTEEGQKRFKKEKEKVKSTLDEEVTWEDLMENPS